MKIAAYSDDWVEYLRDGETLEDYISKSIITKDLEEVKSILTDYLGQEARSEEVRSLVESLLSDKELLKKIQLVNDLSFRNVGIVIKPKWIYISVVYDLGYIKEYAETVFIILRDLEDFTYHGRNQGDYGDNFATSNILW